MATVWDYLLEESLCGREPTLYISFSQGAQPCTTGVLTEHPHLKPELTSNYLSNFTLLNKALNIIK